MRRRTRNELFTSELWHHTLDHYGRATNLTLKLFDADARMVLGPVHPTPFFQLLEETAGYDPGIFSECARRCLAQSGERPAVMVSEFFGLTVIGTSLVVNDKIVGAAVGGYTFVDFAQSSEVQRLARESGIPFDRLWQTVRKQNPVPHRRLILNGELLQVLGDGLLRENKKTRNYGAVLLQSDKDLRALGARLLTLQDDERRWLARELHDDILQRFAALQIQVGSLRRKPPEHVSEVGKELERIENELDGITDEVRALSHRLHPSILDELGLEAAMRQLVSESAKRISSAIQFQSENLPPAIPSDIATALYRIAQEALGNILKHAPDAPITVTLAYSANQLRLVVEDKGPGFDANKNKQHAGLGLLSMQERAILVDGKAIITSTPGQGTKVEVTVPCRPEGV